VSEARQQAFIAAPVDVVWELLSDVNRHPEWWPRVLEVECEGLEAGCTYREVVKTPIGKDEMLIRVDGLEDCQELTIRCVHTGTFVQMLLTEAQEGTFVDARFGMEPQNAKAKLIDMVAGKRYFRVWLRDSLAAMELAANRRLAHQSGG
jgi:uncharacterized protein YndB with AHSA1/START domain